VWYPKPANLQQVNRTRLLGSDPIVGTASASLSVRFLCGSSTSLTQLWGFSLYLRWELFLCAAEAAPSVGRLGYLGSTFVISFDVLMLAVLFHWRA